MKCGIYRVWPGQVVRSWFCGVVFMYNMIVFLRWMDKRRSHFDSPLFTHVLNISPIHANCSPESWLREASQVTLATDTASCTRRGKHYTDQQIGRVVFLVLYGIINVILFTLHAYKHRDTNAYIIVARGCGMCLNFNCAFIIVPVLRWVHQLVWSLRVRSSWGCFLYESVVWL